MYDDNLNHIIITSLKNDNQRIKTYQCIYDINIYLWGGWVKMDMIVCIRTCHLKYTNGG